MIVRKVCILILGFISICYMSGCETAGAFGTKRISPKDVGYIVHSGTTGRRSTPVIVDPASADQRERPQRPWSRWKEAWSQLSKVDPWIEDNLW
ncbi:MAG: hypothetical protein MUC52_01690 [Candidatus Omnitrophica bacterium]|jgi:hypothetical protein|nr:hypothetical protein [Candidatus Omnitrophota bacterium]